MWLDPDPTKTSGSYRIQNNNTDSETIVSWNDKFSILLPENFSQRKQFSPVLQIRIRTFLPNPDPVKMSGSGSLRTNFIKKLNIVLQKPYNSNFCILNTYNFAVNQFFGFSYTYNFVENLSLFLNCAVCTPFSNTKETTLIYCKQKLFQWSTKNQVLDNFSPNLPKITAQ